MKSFKEISSVNQLSVQEEDVNHEASFFIFFRGLVEARESSGPWAKVQSSASRGQR